MKQWYALYVLSYSLCSNKQLNSIVLTVKTVYDDSMILLTKPVHTMLPVRSVQTMSDQWDHMSADSVLPIE